MQLTRKVKQVCFIIITFCISNICNSQIQLSAQVDIVNLILESQDASKDQLYVKCVYEINSFNQELSIWDSKLLIDSVLIESKKFKGSLNFIQNEDSFTLQNIPSEIIGQPVHITFYYPLVKQLDPSKWGGVYNQEDYWFNMGVGMQSIPHSFGRVLFPTKDDFNFKIKVRAETTCDTNHRFSFSGLMTTDTIINDKRKQSFELQEPVPSYLINFVFASQQCHRLELFSQLQKKNIPTVIFHPKDLKEQTTDRFSYLPRAFNIFEEAYGMYRFPQIGYSLVPFYSGAMEHVCNISFPINSVVNSDLINFQRLMAHELSHHWWGNNTTCSKAQEMWLNEGWAAYSEWEYLDKVYGREMYWDVISSEHELILNYIKTQDEGLYLLNEIPLTETYGMHSYKKGADVIRSLRYMIGDSSFYKFCLDFQREFAFKNVSTEDFLNFLRINYSGSPDIIGSFESWYFKHKEYPLLQIKPKGKNIYSTINDQANKNIILKWVVFTDHNKLKIQEDIKIKKGKKEVVSLHPFQKIATNSMGKIVKIPSGSQSFYRSYGVTEISNNSTMEYAFLIKKVFIDSVSNESEMQIFNNYWEIKTFEPEAISFSLESPLPDNVTYESTNQWVVLFKTSTDEQWKTMKTGEGQWVYDLNLKRIKVVGLNLKNGFYTFAKIKS